MPKFKYCPRCAAPLTQREVEGGQRRACSKQCGFVLYENPTPVVAAVVEHEGCVVLARNRSWPIPFYGLITGFLERDEQPDQCALREVHEELRLTADEATLIGVYAFPQLNQVIIGYHVQARGEIVLNEELVDYRRVPPAECQVWGAGTGDVLRDWLTSRGFTPAVMDFKGFGAR